MAMHRTMLRGGALHPLQRPAPLPPPPDPFTGTADERREKWLKLANQGYSMDGRVRVQRPITDPGPRPRPAVAESDQADVTSATPKTGSDRGLSPTTNAKPLFECAICWWSIHKATVTNCGHMFCNRCILTWKKRHNSCPLCHSHLTGFSRIFEVDRVIEEHAAKCKKIHRATQTVETGDTNSNDPGDPGRLTPDDDVANTSPTPTQKEFVGESTADETEPAKSVLMWIPLDSNSN